MKREPLLLAVWRQNRLLPVIILTLLLVNLAVYWALAGLVWPRLAELEREYIGLQTRVRGDHAGAARTPQEAYALAESDLARFREFLPDRGELPALVSELSSMGRENGLTVAQVSYDPKELEEQKLLAYSLQFSVAGTYAGIKSFIQSLEQSSRLIVFEDLALDSASQADQAGQVTVRIRLVTYFRSEPS